MAAKGILAIRAFAEFLLPQNNSLQRYYRELARAYSDFWIPSALDGDHYTLEYRLPGTWSTKYNLLYQDILKLDVFPPSVLPMERAYYLAHQLNQFGVPLDNRANFAKADWLMWMFASASQTDFQTVSIRLFNFFNVTTTRIPLTDWYYTSLPMAVGPFRARPVVGGFFARQLFFAAEE